MNKKNVTVIVGGAWGDEGKGKVASREAKDAVLDIRATGGANAGHTVVFGNTKVALHLIPGGIIYPQITALIGQGVVLDPEVFLGEVDLLKNAGIPYVKKRVRISGRAHLVLPYHKHLDALHERMKDNPIGTTGRGIGPAYEDKKSRVGLRVYDLFLPIDELERKIKVATRLHYQLFMLNGMEEFIEDPRKLALRYHEYAAEISRNNVINGDILTEDVCNRGGKVVVEGAQAYRLDNDYGDYEDVTSSNCVTAGQLLGAHLSHKYIDKVIVIGKAHCSRVGNGVFPTELFGHEAEVIREICHEYGTTTGRPRRVGWGDAVLLKSACSLSVNGADYLCINHLDSLGQIGKILGEVKLCTLYKYVGDKKIQHYPDDINLTHKTPEPWYRVFKGGWDIPSTVRNYEDLPEMARTYIEAIEKTTGIPVKYIGVGPDNEDMIVREEL